MEGKDTNFVGLAYTFLVAVEDLQCTDRNTTMRDRDALVLHTRAPTNSCVPDRSTPQQEYSSNVSKSCIVHCDIIWPTTASRKFITRAGTSVTLSQSSTRNMACIESYEVISSAINEP